MVASFWGYTDFKAIEAWDADKSDYKADVDAKDTEIGRLRKIADERMPDCSDKDREIESLQQSLNLREAEYESLLRNGVTDPLQAQELEEVRQRLQTSGMEAAYANTRVRDIRGQLQEIFKVTLEVMNAIGDVHVQPMKAPEVSDVIATLLQLPEAMAQKARRQNKIQGLEAQLREDSPDLRRIRQSFLDLNEQARQAAINLGEDPQEGPNATNFITWAAGQIHHLRDLFTDRNLRPEETTYIENYRNQTAAAIRDKEELQRLYDFLQGQLRDVTNASKQPEAIPVPGPAPDAYKDRQIALLLNAMTVISEMVNLIQRYKPSDEILSTIVRWPWCGSDEKSIDWLLQHSQIELHMLPRSVLDALITDVIAIVVVIHLAMSELEDLPETGAFGDRVRRRLRLDVVAVRAEEKALRGGKPPSSPGSPGHTFQVPSPPDSDSDSDDGISGPGGGGSVVTDPRIQPRRKPQTKMTTTQTQEARTKVMS